MSNILFLSFVLNFASMFALCVLIPCSHPTKRKGSLGLAVFNPMLWKDWLDFNWVGAIIIVLVLGAIWWPYALCYWIYKLLTWHPKKKRR